MKFQTISRLTFLVQGAYLATAAYADDAQKPLTSGDCLPALKYAPEIGSRQCFENLPGLRAFSRTVSLTRHHDVESCAELCGRLGYSQAGIKHFQNRLCVCGNEINIKTNQIADTESTCDESGLECKVSQIPCDEEDMIEVYEIRNPIINEKAGSSFPDCAREPLCSHDVCDASLSDRDRAAALVAELTIWEKLDNLVNEAPGVPRLGIPPYEWWSEGLHGVASSPGTKFASEGKFSYATSFPQPIVLGSSFDDELVRAVGDIVSKEARAFSNVGRSGLDLYSPNINAFKDPRWGRGQETPGEDPFHLQKYVSAMLTGLEGTDPSKKLIATCKHYAANDFENYNGVDRAGFDANITTQDLSEYYLPPFKTCAVEKNVGSFMCSYNGINGTPLCANSYLLEDILRKHWEWNGEGQYISTDCDCVALMVSYHHYAPDLGHAAAWSMKAGTDLECNAFPGSEALQLAWNNSLISEKEVDKSLTRMYTSLVSVGLFDSAKEDPLRSLSWDDVNTKEAQDLAYRAAVEGAVLLKNDGILPLSLESPKKYALIGPWVTATTQMQGNYFGPAPYLISPRRAAKDLELDFTYFLGSRINSSDSSFKQAIKSAEAADVVIFMGGVDNTLEAETLDRKTLAWPEPQLKLIRALSDVGKPLVVLQFGDGQVDDTELLANDSVNAILWGGYPGQSGGKAILDIVFGRAAPAGRLSVTQYPESYNEAVPSTDMNLRPVPGNSGLGRTYRWYTGRTPVPYGFGLHYTKFNVDMSSKMGPLVTRTDQAAVIDDEEDVAAENVGEVTSDYVALIFLRSEAGPEPRPKKTLVGYTRLRDIKPGETKQEDVVITMERLVRVDELGNRVLYEGYYDFSLDIDEKVSHGFLVGGDPWVFEKFPQPKEKETRDD
ncbi:glycoside hydrolase family 3 protein [Colletotrichum karsti]|uniref:xylan 1,4-beta-xylosidase n=1 Tax=Colletotrichum karsti TaxID=1095194 RepID=A0A9P6LQD0_9PEZI|nr:glycoside hydrolase family 3 protein [Colletotrichum karsti]KAF9880577.1 glycoside hydrolase family 3 protein [Colletotrichum karsti]